jgi:MurNAc alpha-1-phosphate uridylyltransferase
MILAAGRGERLRPVTDSTPKAMVRVKGEHLIDRHLRMLASAGVETVVINLGWLGEVIATHVGSGKRYGLHVVFSPEYDNVLETGGAIVRALPLLGDDPFWVVNADVWTDWQPAGDDLDADVLGELTLVPLPSHRPRGDFSVAGNRLSNVEPCAYTYSGIARYRKAFFKDAGEGRFSIVPMMRAAADAGKLGARIHEGLWEDVGTVARLEQLNSR